MHTYSTQDHAEEATIEISTSTNQSPLRTLLARKEKTQPYKCSNTCTAIIFTMVMLGKIMA